MLEKLYSGIIGKKHIGKVKMAFVNKYHFDNIFFDKKFKLGNFTVYQAGDLYCETDTVVENHEQSYFELSFIVSGSGIIYTDNIPTKVKKGNIYLSFKGDLHKIESDKNESLRYYYISFSADKGTIYEEIIDNLHAKYKDPKSRVTDIPYIFQNMTSILAELTDKKKYYEQLIEANIIQLLICFDRFSNDDRDLLKHYQTHNKKFFVQNLISYIDNNIAQIKNLYELSNKFAFDYSYMSESFKKIIGITLKDYFTQKKMEYAKKLLTHNKKTITEVAEELHYSSIHNFTRAFKNYYKITPQQFKMFNDYSKESKDAKKGKT